MKKKDWLSAQQQQPVLFYNHIPFILYFSFTPFCRVVVPFLNQKGIMAFENYSAATTIQKSSSNYTHTHVRT
jgi:hypothetical protein